jgi:hypothetical protein
VDSSVSETAKCRHFNYFYTPVYPAPIKLPSEGGHRVRLYASSSHNSLQTPWPGSASELYRPSDRCLSAKLVPTFAYRRCHVVSVTDPYWSILVFLYRSRYFFFQVAPQLSWCRVDSVPNALLLRKSGSAGNRTRTSGSIARNSDH